MRHPRAAVVSVTMAAAVYVLSFSIVALGQGGPSEAPAGFDNTTNGTITQTAFDAALDTFAERDSVANSDFHYTNRNAGSSSSTERKCRAPANGDHKNPALRREVRHTGR